MLVQVRDRGLRAGQAVARVGIFGGVFNPPHLGHLVCVQEAHTQLELDVVLLVPVREAPHREIEADPGAEARARMCDQAVGPDARFELSRLEIHRPGPSYTADTLRLVSESSPGDDLVLILGGDEAAALPSWHEPEEVLALSTVAVAEREHVRRDEISARLEGLAGVNRLVFFDMPRIDISSTMVRERAARGLPIRYLVPDKVADFVEARGLYGAPAPMAAE